MMLAVLVAQPAMAGALNQDDMAFAFGDTSAVSAEFGEMALLSDQEMKDTEGEFWPLVYGAAWGIARASILAAGRYGAKKWGFRAFGSSNNHRILLRNNRHVLQTGGRRGGYGKNASHIGWGRSPHHNFSNRHLYLNSRWRIR